MSVRAHGRTAQSAVREGWGLDIEFVVLGVGFVAGGRAIQ